MDPQSPKPKSTKRKGASRRIVTAAQRISPSYFAVLAVISGLILTLGWFLRPRQSTGSLPSERDSLVVERLAQRRALDGMSEYFAETAEELSPYVVWIAGIARSGVVWEGGGAIVTSHGATFAPATQMVTQGGSIERSANLTAGSPLGPIAAYKIENSEGMLAVPRLGPEFLDSDVWLLAVWRPNAGNFAFAPGIFVGTRAGSCGEFPMAEIITNLPLRRSMIGAGLFDLDGALVGLVVSCPEGAAAMAVGSVESAVMAAGLPVERVLARFGFTAAPAATESERRLFPTESSLVVSGVWFDTPAGSAGLTPGDEITGIGGKPGADLDVIAAHPADAPLNLAIRRNRREIRLSLEPSGHASHPAGVLLSRPIQGIPVDSVDEDSIAGQAGLRPGDAIRSIGGQDVTGRRDTTLALLGKIKQPAWVVVRRGPSFRGFVIEPAPETVSE